MNEKQIRFVGHKRTVEPIGIVTEYTLLLDDGTKQTVKITDPIPSVSFSRVVELSFNVNKENTQ